MRKTGGIIACIVFFALGTALGIGVDRLWRSGRNHDAATGASSSSQPASESDDEEPEPAAIVRTVAAVLGQLPRNLEALGVAALPPTGAFIEYWPADVTVTRVFVQPGEMVAQETPLVQISLTREAESQTASAQLAVETTSKALEVAQQRLERGLATRPEVVAAQAARDEAAQRLERLQAGAPPSDGVLRAHSSGVVMGVRVQAGATVLAGTSIVEISSGAVVAQIGIDPGDAAGLNPGQAFDIRPVDDRDGSHWSATLSLIAPIVNPTSRLVDATLMFDDPALPRSGTPLRARASLPGSTGVVIPRAALVPEEDGMVVFVVKDGTAVRKPVIVAQRGDGQVVLAGGCEPGDRVVVSGQSQLTAGAEVREIAVESPAAKPNGGPGADR